jgi:nucleoside-diphosphate-sugar epimerase
MIVPAEKGAETILNSALKAGPQLTSVVLTSSTAAIVNPDKEPNYTFTEADWASAALEKAIKDRDEGVQTPAGVLYSASKTASDRAVWRFRDAHNPPFAITTINPSVVIGPPVVLPVSGDKLNETLRPVFNILAGNTGGKSIIPPNIGTASFVDVRDVAFLHIWAYENPSKADGERYLATQGFGPLQAAADILRYEYKDRPEILEKIPVGKPGDGYHGYDEKTGEVSEVIGWSEGRFRVSGKKAEREMGVKYISFRKSVVDTAKAFEPLL